jgi:hypothetical protein
VSSRTIEQAIDDALASGRPSRGHDLAGFAIDLEHFVAEAGVEVCSVDETGDLRCLLALAGTHPGPLAEITSSLVRVWEKSLRYPGPTAHVIDGNHELVRLRFVTSAADGELVVTGEVMVRLRAKA